MMEDEGQIDVELEILASIYIHELEILPADSKYVKTVKVNLKPATGDNEESQWVYLELWFHIPKEYPDELPDIRIRNPRGLSDQCLQTIESELQEIAESNSGMQMLFQLIEAAKEHLTQGNLPACECAICLCSFRENDVFVKTQCFHYFHSHCLNRYLKCAIEEIREKKAEAAKNNSPLKEPLQLVCPMCRLEIPEDIIGISTGDRKYPSPQELSNQTEFSLTPDLRLMQAKMKKLYLRQKAKGGIIDIEDEKNRFLLQIATQDDEEERQNPLESRVDAPVESLKPVINNQTQQDCSKEEIKSVDKAPELSESEDDEQDGRGGRQRNRRGKNRMYPTPSEKKRAHMQALQAMNLERKGDKDICKAEKCPSNTVAGGNSGANSNSGRGARGKVSGAKRQS